MAFRVQGLGFGILEGSGDLVSRLYVGHKTPNRDYCTHNLTCSILRKPPDS